MRGEARLRTIEANPKDVDTPGEQGHDEFTTWVRVEADPRYAAGSDRALSEVHQDWRCDTCVELLWVVHVDVDPVRRARLLIEDRCIDAQVGTYGASVTQIPDERVTPGRETLREDGQRIHVGVFKGEAIGLAWPPVLARGMDRVLAASGDGEQQAKHGER